MTDSQLCTAMDLLGIGSEDFVFQSARELEDFKALARKRLRVLAKTHHPDCTDQHERVELFRAAAQIVSDIETTEFAPVFTATRKKRRRYSFTVTT